jgi:hypothetical protein
MKNYTGDIIWAGHDMAPSDRKERGDDRKTKSCVFEEGAMPIKVHTPSLPGNLSLLRTSDTSYNSRPGPVQQ